jgi:hypothetical protein
MQLMLGIYEFPAEEGRPSPYPKEFTVDSVRGFRRTGPAGVSVRPPPRA